MKEGFVFLKGMIDFKVVWPVLVVLFHFLTFIVTYILQS